MMTIENLHLFLWLTVGGCLLISFLFSGIEAGILNINPVKFRHQVSEREPGALALRSLLEEPERLLLTVVIVTNTLNILAVTLMTDLLVVSLGNIGYGVALVALLPVYLFGLELFPKALFRRIPYSTLVFLAQPLRLTVFLLSPVLRAVIAITELLSPLRSREPRKLFGTREDLKLFTVESARAKLLSPATCRLIHNVIDFRDVTAWDLMQPLSDFVAIPHDSDVQSMVAMSRGGTVERFLAVSATGEIIGLVNLFEAMLDRKPHSRISSYIRRLTPVNVNEVAPDLMRKLRAARTPVALVIDGEKPVGILLGGALYRQLFAPAV